MTGPTKFELIVNTRTAKALGIEVPPRHLSSDHGRLRRYSPIVGWPKTTFMEIMGEYRAKKRANTIMQTIAVRLSEEEIAALAAYFGSLRPAN